MQNKIQLMLPLAAITLLSPFLSFGQAGRIPAHKRIEMEHETLGDAHLPNAYQNKKTSPAYKYRSGAVLKTTTNSTIFTNQVNVDAGGQNIIGDAANEPNIAVNPLNPDEMVIGWRQFDNIASNFRQAGWSYTTDAGQTWTFPGEIEQGIFRSDPVLDYDASGNFYYNSLTVDVNNNFFCKVFKSANGGATWNSGNDAGGGDKQWMAIDRTAGAGSGNIYSAWTSGYSSCLPGYFTRSSTGSSSFEPCTVVDGDPSLGTETVGINGELYITGNDPNGNIIISKSLNAQTPGSIISWNLPVTVFMDGYINGWGGVNPQGLFGQVNTDVDHSNGLGQGNVYILASLGRISNGDPADVMFSRSTDGGLTWSVPIPVNDDNSTTNTQWLGTLSVAPNGRIDVVWLDTRDNPGSDESALYYSYSTDQGTTWSVNEKLSNSFDPHLGYPNQDKMGDYFDMISDNSGAHLAWANTLNGEEDVYYSHIVPPVASAVNEISENTAFSIFPNPTTGKFVITGAGKQSRIEICNAFGEKIYSAEILKTKTGIDISSQSAGIYFLKIINPDGNSAVRKIIRE